MKLLTKKEVIALRGDLLELHGLEGEEIRAKIIKLAGQATLLAKMDWLATHAGLPPLSYDEALAKAAKED